MPSTYTSSNRFEKPGLLEQDGTWGNTLNTDLDLVDAAISGYVTIAMPDADYTLSVASGAADQSRLAILQFTGTMTQTRVVNIPAVSKLRAIDNSTNQGLQFYAGGTPYILAPGRRALIYCDGTNVYLVSSNTTDATTLDGQSGSYYRNAGNLNAGTVPNARLPISSTSVAGIVRMLNTPLSDSVTEAPTANALNQVYSSLQSNITATSAAQTAANAAQTTANSAQTTANTAQSTATTARNTANAAQTTANTANTNATAAQFGLNLFAASFNDLRLFAAAVVTGGGTTVQAINLSVADLGTGLYAAVFDTAADSADQVIPNITASHTGGTTDIICTITGVNVNGFFFRTVNAAGTLVNPTRIYISVTFWR